MTILANVLLGAFIVWAFLAACSIPVLAALMRSSQISRAERSDSPCSPNTNPAHAETSRPGVGRVASPRRAAVSAQASTLLVPAKDRLDHHRANS
jgi:hypothetical protein